MIDKTCIQQVLGSLMKHPQFLSETDKYRLTPNDFSSTFEKYLFAAISGLYFNGAKNINIIDIENYLSTNPTAKSIFESHNGIEYLQDIEEYTSFQNFDYYYTKLKKYNLLKDLKKIGIDTKDFYIEDLANNSAMEVNANFEKLEIKDIINNVKKKLITVEHGYLYNDVTETKTACEDIEELLESFKLQEDIGLPLQGDLFNEIIGGARKGVLCIRSGASGLSKSRQAVGDACLLAYPYRYNWTINQWEQVGNNEKVLYIATEQDFKEIKSMILAYLTGMNESKFRYNNFTEFEQHIIKQAVAIMKKFEDNFFIVRMPNPTVELIKTIIRENALLRNVEYVFYDYIFINPSVLHEFKHFNLRNDEVLLLIATALKDLAVELNVFIMTSTQVNSQVDNNKEIRNEGSMAGGRSTINKADIGCVMARPTYDEIEIIEKASGIRPNIVTDIFKVRSGRWTQVRIWSIIDLGNLRKKDIIVTDSQLSPLPDFEINFNSNTRNWDEEKNKEVLSYLDTLNNLDLVF